MCILHTVLCTLYCHRLSFYSEAYYLLQLCMHVTYVYVMYARGPISGMYCYF